MVLTAAAWVVCAVRMVPCDSLGTIRTVHNAPDDGRTYPKHVELRIQQ